jgi:hypothetical protein
MPTLRVLRCTRSFSANGFDFLIVLILMLRLSRLALILGIACPFAAAQQLIGYVNTRDAEVTGASDVLDGQAVLTGSAGVTARDHTAPVKLGRGGTVRVCQTSVVHITESKSAEMAAPLLFSLDRGAIEIEMGSTLGDAIMTPDLRFTVVNKGPLNLRLRVARNGDTCVENRGANAPTLNISDPFGEALYQVGAGQHVMFEHGSLREVVDQEKNSCGCPDKPGMSVADALLASGGTKTVMPAPAAAPAPPPTVVTVVPATPAPAVVASAPAQPDSQAQLRSAEQAAAAAAMRAAEERHPFPTAISEGLAPAPEAPQAALGAPHAVGDTLSYNAPAPAMTPSAAAPAAKNGKKSAAAAAPQPVAGQPGAAAPRHQSNDVVHAMGRFFKRLFGG